MARGVIGSGLRDDLDGQELGVEVRVAVTRAVLLVIAGRGDLLQDVQAAGHGAERRVERRERRVLPGEEELAAVRVRSGVGHGDCPRGIRGTGQVLVVEFVPRPACAGAGGVAALQHVDAFSGQPMAVSQIVISLARQEPERERGARRQAGEHLHRDHALRGEELQLVGEQAGSVLGSGVSRGREGAKKRRLRAAGRP
jgi:hypothetical protein